MASAAAAAIRTTAFFLRATTSSSSSSCSRNSSIGYNTLRAATATTTTCSIPPSTNTTNNNNNRDNNTNSVHGSNCGTTRYYQSTTLAAAKPFLQPRIQFQQQQSTNTTVTNNPNRRFHSESEFHTQSDASLETIQDCLDEWLEDHLPDDNNNNNYEITLASGVLTIALPPHGTWVMNKQTPNQQLWWSSPFSGPKRFEYLDESWRSTKDGLVLGPLLAQEIMHALQYQYSDDDDDNATDRLVVNV